MRCNKCIYDPKEWQICNYCKDNPKFADYPIQSFYQEYKPVCPRGYDDCVYDPAYIKHQHPEWYKDLYGDLSPEEVINVENGCADQARKDPEERYYCYDDEDK